MSRRSDCYDNAVVEHVSATGERSFATLEHELLADADADARRAIFGFLVVWYDGGWRHSSVSYVSPVRYKQHLAQGAWAA